MKFRNDSKKSRWDLASDGFWSKKSIRELLSLLLLRHGMVCTATVIATTVGEVGVSDFLSASAMIPTSARHRCQDAVHRCSRCRWTSQLAFCYSVVVSVSRS
jgi:hypothetical protein